MSSRYIQDVESKQIARRPLSIVIVTFNSAAVLPRLLDSLPAGLRGLSDLNVIVVDNDSRDGSGKLAEAHPLGPTVIQMGRNAGYAAAINAAVATIHPNSDLLILNPDVRLHPGAAKPLVELAATPTVGIAVPRNFREDGTTDPTLRREPSVFTAWAEAVLGGKLAARLGWGEIVGRMTSYGSRDTIEWATGSALLVSAYARPASTSSTSPARKSCIQAVRAAPIRCSSHCSPPTGSATTGGTILCWPAYFSGWGSSSGKP
jgi:N-acetylglucosaminyl-diphospho-decaprenol L-rhamnosyltransferase